MRIEELSDGQKTVMLAELANMTPDVMNSGVLCVDLYDVANMALAWRVLNWAGANFNKARPGDWRGAMYGSRHSAISEWVGLSPADAQRTWLDRILSLAIEAGMVAGDE